MEKQQKSKYYAIKLRMPKIIKSNNNKEKFLIELNRNVERFVYNINDKLATPRQQYYTGTNKQNVNLESIGIQNTERLEQLSIPQIGKQQNPQQNIFSVKEQQIQNQEGLVQQKKQCFKQRKKKTSYFFILQNYKNYKYKKYQQIDMRTDREKLYQRQLELSRSPNKLEYSSFEAIHKNKILPKYTPQFLEAVTMKIVQQESIFDSKISKNQLTYQENNSSNFINENSNQNLSIIENKESLILHKQKKEKQALVEQIKLENQKKKIQELLYNMKKHNLDKLQNSYKFLKFKDALQFAQEKLPYLLKNQIRDNKKQVLNIMKQFKKEISESVLLSQINEDQPYLKLCYQIHQKIQQAKRFQLCSNLQLIQSENEDKINITYQKSIISEFQNLYQKSLQIQQKSIISKKQFLNYNFKIKPFILYQLFIDKFKSCQQNSQKEIFDRALIAIDIVPCNDFKIQIEQFIKFKKIFVDKTSTLNDNITFILNVFQLQWFGFKQDQESYITQLDLKRLISLLTRKIDDKSNNNNALSCNELYLQLFELLKLTSDKSTKDNVDNQRLIYQYQFKQCLVHNLIFQQDIMDLILEPLN